METITKNVVKLQKEVSEEIEELHRYRSHGAFEKLCEAEAKQEYLRVFIWAVVRQKHEMLRSTERPPLMRAITLITPQSDPFANHALCVLFDQ